MPDARSRPERPPAERLPLGQASRLLGVDPDTLRRWADEGRVPAFTTPRRPPPVRAPRPGAARRRPADRGARAPWRGVGDTTDRLNAAYRRRYGELARRRAPTSARSCPKAQRDEFRETGRSARRGARPLPRRHGRRTGRGPRPRPSSSRRLLGERVRSHGIPLESGRLDVHRGPPPFLAELRLVARRRAGVNAVAIGQLYDASTGLLDRLLLAFVAAHATSGAGDDLARVRGRPPDERILPALDLDPRGAVRRDAARPVARASPRLPARLGVRDAVLRARRRRRGGRRRERLERAPLPRVVPDRRHLDRRLAGPRDGVPARAHAVRLHVRGAACCSGRC